jgi:putative transposase
MIESYKYRLNPNNSQKELLNKHFGCVRKVYNLALDFKKKSYEEGKNISCYEIKKFLPLWKKEFAYLKEINSLSLQQAILNLDKAFLRFFKKLGGFPKFKSKKNLNNCFAIPANTKVDFVNGLVKIPKFLEGIKCNFHRGFEGKVKSSSIRKEANGDYFINITVETKDKEIQPFGNEVLGLDLGLKDFLIDSNGKKTENPRFLKTSLKRLKRLSRQHSKSKIQSKNREKKKLKLAILHRRVANQRNDFLHKESFKIADDNQVGTVVVETLKVKNMIKNRTLSRAISDVSWSKFVTFLEYKLFRLGKKLIKISTFFPSSKQCNNCNSLNQELTLSQREWQCSSCSVIHDRDINAAINIRNEGLRLSTGGITGN